MSWTSLISKGVTMIYDFTGVNDLPEPHRWRVHGRHSLYESRWVSLDLVDVEPHGGERYEHHVISIPYRAVCVVVQHPDRGVLLLYRHRFITDTKGFELPAGGVEPGESVPQAASREVLEETGWEISTPKVFLEANASDGVSDQKFHFAYARAIRQLGEPSDKYESDRLYWVPQGEIPSLVKNGQVPGCSAMLGLMYALSYGILDADA